MFEGGYMGRVLRVDLGTRQATREDLPFEIARDFIGGAGFGIKCLYDEVPAHADPLGPDNRIVFACGPLSGTRTPCASRMSVTSKSPLTGAVGMSMTGGYFPAELKFAGYDAVVIQGRASTPVYLLIQDDKVEIRDADWLWGTSCQDCQELIRNKHRDQSLRTACIGPAGERLNRIACIINERRAAGRKGLGAVMGSKNLKAIAVRGTGKVGIADPDGYRAAEISMNKAMKESPVLYPSFSKLGTPMVVDLLCSLGVFPGKNWSATGEFDPAEQIGVPAQNERALTTHNCYGCPVSCTQIKLSRGKHVGLVGEPEYESFYSFGGATGVADTDAIIAADRMCDELGLDSMSTGATIGFAMELFEKGMLGPADTQGLDLRFGNSEAMLETITHMAFRRGVGELLADGVKVAAERLGNGAHRYAMHVKGLELPGYDVRGLKAHGLNFVTAYTGADHNRGYAWQEVFGIPIPEQVDRFATEGKGKLAKWNQDTRCACCDLPTTCAFLMDMVLLGSAKITSELLTSVTGISFPEDEVITAGERVNNLGKAFNVREGFTRADDKLPDRLMEEPLKAGQSKGQVISRGDLDAMLDEYYEARGWDRVTGVPTPEKLQALGLGYVADDLVAPVAG